MAFVAYVVVDEAAMARIRAARDALAAARSATPVSSLEIEYPIGPDSLLFVQPAAMCYRGGPVPGCHSSRFDPVSHVEISPYVELVMTGKDYGPRLSVSERGFCWVARAEREGIRIRTVCVPWSVLDRWGQSGEAIPG